MKEIRVLLAHDRALIRSGIRALLERLPDLHIVGEAGDGTEALRLIGQRQPDVALIEGAMSMLNGANLTDRVSKECPSVYIVVLSTQNNESCLRRALGYGASGYLTMTVSPMELELAVRTVAKGNTYVSPSATGPLVDFVRSQAVHERFECLTPRQLEVLQLTAEGNSMKEIALLLNISIKTVETHRMLLTERLDIHHTAGLVRYALRTGLIRLED